MNYLAHIYLSEGNENIQLGNFFADAVKGNSYLNYPAEMQKGILLHRKIDTFTDVHGVVKRSKARLNSSFGLYKGIIIDIFYDHFLAKNWHRFSTASLDDFADSFYENLMRNFEILPEKIQYLAPFLVEQNWLKSYAALEGIEKVLVGMNKRTNYHSKMDLAMKDLVEHYDLLEMDFLAFFPELSAYAHSQLMEL
ncbi:MAG: ACP phosphodiesterase [Flavobacteriaceae bacterium]|nr:ACP phosphodiesterase [Flavobacteriaceae bacterium]